jgi:hypothetical protein
MGCRPVEEEISAGQGRKVMQQRHYPWVAVPGAGGQEMLVVVLSTHPFRQSISLAMMRPSPSDNKSKKRMRSENQVSLTVAPLLSLPKVYHIK